MIGWGMISVISLVIAINILALTLSSFHWVKQCAYRTYYAKQIARIKAEKEHDELLDML